MCREQTALRLSIEAKSFTMSMDLPEFQACVTAYRNWFQEILNSMDVPWSNGFIEGCNNKTKVLTESRAISDIIDYVANP